MTIRFNRYGLILLLLALILSSLPQAVAEYSLTPLPISEASVREKLYQLGYLPSIVPKRNATKTTLHAMQAFQTEQALDITEELDTRTLVRLFVQADEQDASIWIPVYGGKKYHNDEVCSQMNDPEPAAIRTAAELGFLPCKLCKPPAFPLP